MHCASCSRCFTLRCSIEAHTQKLAGRVACSSAPARSPPSPLFKMSYKNAQDGINCLERWQFLKQLPDSIIRDIGFVVSSPSILLNSHELPTVSSDLLGGGKKAWPDSMNWLLTIDMDHVKQWFGAKSNNGRLGEHFAFCVEYVLLFAPFARVGNLKTFMQVTNRTVEAGLPVHPIDSECHVNMAVEVGKDEKDGVLIRSVIGKSTEMEGVGQNLEGPTEDFTEDFVATCSHLQELKTNCKSEIREPKIEDDAPPATNGPRESSSERIGKRKRKLLRKMQRPRDGKGATTTIGEFDFLFEHASKQDGELCPPQTLIESSPLEAHSEITINHWEVSVKFLLYAGPWEVFGYKTPDCAAWHGLKQDSKDDAAGQSDMRRQHSNTTWSVESCELLQNGWHANTFLGCFLGPHVGETLYNRKTRLINQLALSQNIHAASLLWLVFGSKSSRSSSSAEDTHHFSKEGLRTTSDEACRHMDDAINRENAEVLRVCSQALLKGYLFYECDLWCQLYSRETLGQGVNHLLEALNKKALEDQNKKARNSAGDLGHEVSVNPEHWSGWWTRAQNFAKFARLSVHEHSKWYIVPKLEWLSPVVICAEDEVRVPRVLSLDDFLMVAEKVAEEAERTNSSRKRRFMVAEVVWESLNVDQCAVDSGGSRGQVYDESLKGLGRWTEVSRGFLVEDTWPDSRLYSPHGFRQTSLP